MARHFSLLLMLYYCFGGSGYVGLLRGLLLSFGSDEAAFAPLRDGEECLGLEERQI